MNDLVLFDEGVEVEDTDIVDFDDYKPKSNKCDNFIDQRKIL